MEGRGSQSDAPRMVLPRRFIGADSVIFWTAFLVSALFVVGQIGFFVTVTPVMITLSSKSSVALPPLLSLASSLGPFGIIGVLGVVDLVIFLGFYWLGRHHWIGMLFVPPMLYLGSAAMAFMLWWPRAAGLLR